MKNNYNSLTTKLQLHKKDQNKESSTCANVDDDGIILNGLIGDE